MRDRPRTPRRHDRQKPREENPSESFRTQSGQQPGHLEATVLANSGETQATPPSADALTCKAGSPPDPARLAGQKTKTLKHHSLIDKVYRYDNLYTAWRKVRANKGAHGIDRMTIKAYEADAETHLRELQRKLMQGRYQPLPVKRVYIPKASDPTQLRPLGIPTVTDRVCQQAVYQILSPIFDPEFSERSYGFRPHRSAQQAIATLIGDAKAGFRHVVDADIASFFDRLDYDVMMSRVRQKIADGRVLDLIEAFLKAGVCEGNTVSIPLEGSPQGGVISPLLANIVLDSLDKALETNGWRHVRYADDFVILTRSADEAAQALADAKEVLENLKLSLHETKTRLTEFKHGFDFLGMHFRRNSVQPRQQSLNRFKDKVRKLTRRQQGRNVDAVLDDLNPVIRGWARYFGSGDCTGCFRQLDRWIRMRIRNFRMQRRNRNDNWRLTNEVLAAWGLLSLQQCRPERILSYRRAKTVRAVRIPCNEDTARGRPVAVTPHADQ